MCGIAGIIEPSFNHSETQILLEKMQMAMAHRGPDAHSTYYSAPIGLVHRRLAIIDLSEESNQPMHDYSGRYTIVFNGEIYNYAEIKNELDYPFVTKGDTEVILAAYIKWGATCLQKLNGMFAIAIWDNNTKSLFLARDRMAVKPLYYYHNNNTLVFASEIRTILAAGIVPKKLNQTALVDYLSYQSVHAPNTLIENLHQLKGGQYAVFNGNVFSITTYWDMLKPNVEFNISNFESAKNIVTKYVDESIKLRMVSDVPIGVFLSGGIDSSVIASKIADIAHQPINTLTVGFQEKLYDETDHATQMAKQINCNHTVFTLTANDFLGKLPTILMAMDNPSVDGPNTYIVSEMAKGHKIKVVESGIGGDELFVGYPLYKQIKLLMNNKWFWLLPKFLPKFIFSIGRSGRIKNKINQLFDVMPDLPNIYSTFRKVMDEGTIHKLLANNLQDFSKYSWVKNELVSVQNHLEQLPLFSQITYCELLCYTQSVLLKDSDQMSMANSIELREPFFDYRLIELILQIPDKFKKLTPTKGLLLSTLKVRLPNSIVNKNKQTFSLPWDKWIKDELQSFCVQNIAFLRKYPNCFNFENIEIFWDKFKNGDDSIHWSEIWSLVVLGHWLNENQIEA